jgi:hypothetical protein
MNHQYNIGNYIINFEITDLTHEERKYLLFEKFPDYKNVMVAEGTYASYFYKRRIPKQRLKITIKPLNDHEPIIETKIIWR